MKKQTSFGLEQLSNPTPLWAKQVFRIVFVLTTVLTFWVAGSTLIAAGIKTELMLGLKSLDMLVFGISKLFGVERPKENDDQ